MGGRPPDDWSTNTRGGSPGGAEDGPTFLHGRLGELQAASALLDKQGCWWRASWVALHACHRTPEQEARDPGEWPHGWQYWASSILDSQFRRTSMLSGRTATCQAHLRSHSGRNAGAATSHAPTAPEFEIPPHLFRVLFLERLRLPLPLTEKQGTACHEPLDHFGRHRALLATDYMFMGEDRTPIAILGGCDGLTRALFADVVLCKGTSHGHAERALAHNVLPTGHQKVILQSDQEPSIIDVKHKACTHIETAIVYEESPVGDTNSNGRLH